MSTATGGAASVGATAMLPSITEGLRKSFIPLLLSLEQIKTEAAYTYMIELMFTLARFDASLQEEERRLFVCAYDALIEGLVKRRRQIAEKKGLLRECHAFLDGLRERCHVLREVCEARVLTITALQQQQQQQQQVEEEEATLPSPNNLADGEDMRVTTTREGLATLSALASRQQPQPSPLLLLPGADHIHTPPVSSFALVPPACVSSLAERTASSVEAAGTTSISNTSLTPEQLSDSLVVLQNASFTRHPQSCSALQSVLRENFKRKLQRGMGGGGAANAATAAVRTPAETSLYPKEESDTLAATMPGPSGVRDQRQDADATLPLSEHSPLSPAWSLPGHLTTLAHATSNPSIAAAVLNAAAAHSTCASETARKRSSRAASPDRKVEPTSTMSGTGASSRTRHGRQRERRRRPALLFGPALGSGAAAGVGLGPLHAGTGRLGSGMLAPITPSAALAALSTDSVAQLDTSTGETSVSLSGGSASPAVGIAHVWEEVFWSFLTGNVAVGDMQALLALLVAGSPARVGDVATCSGRRTVAKDAASPGEASRERKQTSQRRETIAPSPSSAVAGRGARYTRGHPLSAAEMCLKRLKDAVSGECEERSLHGDDATETVVAPNEKSDDDARRGSAVRAYSGPRSALSSLHWDFWVAIQTSLVVLLEGLLYGTEADPTAVRTGEHVHGAAAAAADRGNDSAMTATADGGEQADRTDGSLPVHASQRPPHGYIDEDSAQDSATRLLRPLTLPSTAALEALRTLCPSLRSYSAGLEAVTLTAPALAARMCEEAMLTVSPSSPPLAKSDLDIKEGHAESTAREELTEAELTLSEAETTCTTATTTTTTLQDEATTVGCQDRIGNNISRAAAGRGPAVLGFTSDISRLSQRATTLTHWSSVYGENRSAATHTGRSAPAATLGAAAMPREGHGGSSATHRHETARDGTGNAMGHKAGSGGSGRDVGGETMPPLPDAALVPADVILHFFVSALSWEVVLTEYAHQQEACLLSASSRLVDDEELPSREMSACPVAPAPALVSASDLVTLADGADDEEVAAEDDDGNPSCDQSRSGREPSARRALPASAMTAAVQDGDERAGGYLTGSAAWTHNALYAAVGNPTSTNALGTAAAASQLLNFSFASVQSAGAALQTPTSATAALEKAGGGGVGTFPSSFFLSRQNTALDRELPPESFYSYVSALAAEGVSLADQNSGVISPGVSPQPFAHSVAAAAGLGGRYGSAADDDLAANGSVTTGASGGGAGAGVANVSFASTTLAVAFEMKRLVEHHIQSIRVGHTTNSSFGGLPARRASEGNDRDAAAQSAPTSRGFVPSASGHPQARRAQRKGPQPPPRLPPYEEGLVGVVIPAVMAAELDDLVTRVGDALEALDHLESQVCGEMTLLTFRVVSTLLDWLIPAVYVADRRTWLYYRKWVCDAYRLMLEEGLLERLADMVDPAHRGMENEWLQAKAGWHGMDGSEEAVIPPEPSNSPVLGPLPTPPSSVPNALFERTDEGADRPRRAVTTKNAKKKKKAKSAATTAANKTGASQSAPTPMGSEDTLALVDGQDGHENETEEMRLSGQSRASFVSMPDSQRPDCEADVAAATNTTTTVAPTVAEQIAALKADPYALVTPGCTVEVVDSPHWLHRRGINPARPDESAKTRKGAPVWQSPSENVSPGLRAARALLDQGTRLLPPRHFLVTRLIAATVRGLGQDVIMYLLASLFTPNKSQLWPHATRRIGAADDDGEEDDADRTATSSVSPTSRAVRQGQANHKEDEGLDPVSQALPTMPDFSMAHSQSSSTLTRSGLRDASWTADTHRRSHSMSATPARDVDDKVHLDPVGQSVAVTHRSDILEGESVTSGTHIGANRAGNNANNKSGAASSSASMGADVPALVHHHRFRYPSVHTPADVCALYEEALEDAEVNLSPHDPVRAAMVLNATDFLIRQGRLRDAHDLIEGYLVDVDEERVQLPRIASVPTASVTDTLSSVSPGAAAAGGGGGTGAGAGGAPTGSAFSVTSVRGGARTGAARVGGQPPSPPLSARSTTATTAGRRQQAAPSTVAVPSSGALSSMGAASATSSLPATATVGDMIPVPTLIPSWGTAVEKDQFIQLLLLLKQMEESLQMRIGVEI